MKFEGPENSPLKGHWKQMPGAAKLPPYSRHERARVPPNYRHEREKVPPNYRHEGANCLPNIIAGKVTAKQEEGRRGG